MNPLPVKRLLLLFWALYFTLVTSSNVCDALRALAVLEESWPFASGNFRMITDATARYGASRPINLALFAGVIAWEGVSAVLFARAAYRFRGRNELPGVRLALAVGLGLWAAFILADEMVFTFKFEETHVRLLIATLATWLVMELIPDM